jgi:hypothetical protein
MSTGRGCAVGAADLPVWVCSECGGENAHAEQAVAERDELLAVAREDIANLERELRVKRAQIARMRAEQDGALQNHPHYAAGQRVLQHWKKTCAPKARELGGKRLDVVLARLNGGYTEADLKRAVDGYGMRPYVVNGKRAAAGARDDWWADAELIFRDAKHVDAGLRIADHADDLQSALTAPAAVLSDPAPNEPEGDLGRIGTRALAYVKLGWHVFPCRPDAKEPATPHGLEDAKCSEAAVRGAWGKYPNLNVAVRTGAESGFVVLDIDGETGADSLRYLERQHGDLPLTASVVTPSGGSHYYFQHPGVELRNTVSILAPGIDTRGDGGYVLAPGSVVNGRPYEVDESAPIAPMPAWLLRALTEHQAAAGRGKSPEERAKLIGEGAGEGSRNQRLASHVGWLLHHHELEVARAMAHAWNEARLKPPLTAREVDQTVDSIGRSDARKRAA